MKVTLLLNMASRQADFSGRKVIKTEDIGQIGKKKVLEVMNESPPIIDKHAKLETIVQLLKFYPILIVKEGGKLAGVITKADVIKCLK